jgi:hypothetical protein
MWLNEIAFSDRPLDDDAVVAMQGLGCKRTLELLLQEGVHGIRRPSEFFKHRARRAGLFPVGRRHHEIHNTSLVPEVPAWRCAGVQGCGNPNPFSTWTCQWCNRQFGT